MQSNITFVKAFTLRDVKDTESIKNDINKGMILIIRITPLAQKDINLLRDAIDELYNFIRAIDGDIARLGDERIVITPHNVKIWKNGLENKSQ